MPVLAGEVAPVWICDRSKRKNGCERYEPPAPITAPRAGVPVGGREIGDEPPMVQGQLF